MSNIKQLIYIFSEMIEALATFFDTQKANIPLYP